MKLKVTLALLLSLAGSAPAWASECSGQPGAGLVCGNNAASKQLPAWSTITLLFDRSFAATQGTILNRGASVWSATATPTLGLNGGTGGSLALNGSTSGTATIGVKAAAGTTTFNLPVGNGSTGFALTTDGSGNTAWTASGSGTATSVGLSLPAIFSVSGSPVTTSGTLTATLANETANTVWAGPTTGAASSPAFRALVGADLPNPSSSSLGGVQSAVGVTHQWINSISTSGVPALSQPAFTDISGSVAAAQLPNPSASTLGGVESLASVASKWINTISTSGVPSATQPAFTDISGVIAEGQLPSISNSSVLGNNSGGTAVPSPLTASNVLDFIGTTQGNILYRNGTVWTPLAVGTDGQVLTTHGAAANPTWVTVSGTGTVTSVASGTGLTGGPITTTGTLSLASIANGTVLANVSGGSAAPIANTPSAILDVIGSTTGNVLYRAAGGTGWAVLAPGTNGQVLTQGASTPAWGNAGSVSNVTITASTGLGSSGTCNITTTGTCTITNSGVVSVKKQVFTTSGTYTPSTGMIYAIIECLGGGAGGGGADAAAVTTAGYGGGGGGAGGYSKTVVTAASVGASKTVTIGGGGAGGLTGSHNGSVGGDTSVGTLCVGKGGSGGLFGSLSQFPTGGAGGIAGTGDLASPGRAGGSGAYSQITTVSLPSGFGGSSMFGSGGQGAMVNGGAVVGVAATVFGSGGSGGSVNGAASTAAGGAGSAGVIFITEYNSQ